jgi:Asp-tRNA(Asn)/Glu-tRNA(Gln) amidotransferase A subunit family amidase
MQLECTSYLGTTTNPHNTRLTPGGSSGGEGALIGFKGSPLGIGTDVGGSIRCPAAHCGIYGFKPTAGRVPYGGCNAPMLPPGWEGILCTHGPMARSAADLELYMKLMADSEPWRRDPSLFVKPWVPVRAGKLRVGVLWDDGVVAPVAPMRRGLEMVAEKLRAAGHEVVPYTPYESKSAWEVLRKLYWPDGGRAVRNCLEEAGEPIHPLSAWIIDQGGDRAPTADELMAVS